MMFALVVVIGTAWVLISLPVAVIVGGIPRMAERRETSPDEIRLAELNRL